MELDVFPVAGQSNAEGRGDSAKSPTVGSGNAYEYTSSSLVHLDDPVGDAETGSAWPAFAIEYYSRTGAKSVYQEVATGASRMTPNGSNGNNGNWHPDENSLYPAAVSDIQSMMTWLSNNGHDATMQGILWWQGESDAQNIDAGDITKSDYKNATIAMIDAFRVDLNRPNLPFFIIQISYQNSDTGTGDTAGYQAVRAAQEEIASSKANTYLIADRAKEMIDEGHYSPSHTGTHLDQFGYDTIGTQGAMNVDARLNGPQFQLKQGTGTENDGYTGLEGEVTADTTDWRLVAHDGETLGGHRLDRLDDT